MVLNGIDVSHAQKITDWSPANLDFIMIKATEGSTYVDPMYPFHLAKAQAAGIPLIGSYHYGNSVAAIHDQVNLFLRVTGGVGLLALDTEHATSIMTLAQMQQFFDTMHAFQKICGEYASEDKYPSNVGEDWRWVANYTSIPKIPYDMHQYRGSPLDLDRSPLTADQLGAFSNPMAQAKITDVTPMIITRGPTWYDIDGVTVLGTGHTLGDSYSPYAAGAKRAFYANSRIYLCAFTNPRPVSTDIVHVVTVDVDGAEKAKINV